MVWRQRLSADGEYGCEAAKIAPIVVPYLQGRALDIGSGPGKVWPQVIGIDPGHNGGKPITDIMADGTNLTIFADASVDAVFSSHFLEHIDKYRVAACLREWSRVLKPEGYMVLYVPSANLYPVIGDEFANPDHKWNIYPGDIEDILKTDIKIQETHGWELILSEERDQDDEYSLLIVLKKIGERGVWRENLWQRNPDGKKRALIMRYGAIGDAFVAASILPHLKAQGYHITFNTQPRIKELLANDPNIDEWFLQENDYVPNNILGPYWNALSKRYDKIVNLSESVEGLFLTLPGRLNHSYSAEARRAIYDPMNYLEHTHNIAAVPHEFSNARFHATEGEERWAKAVRARMDGPVIVWVVNGSSVHKVYPFVQIVAGWLMEKTPAHIVLYGDPGVGHRLAEAVIDVLKQDGIDTTRILNIAQKWKIRQSLAFAKYADCIVGPETGPMNAMAMEDIKKIIYMSHSSGTNLTKHWRNTVTLEPVREMAPCFPCHQLHYSWEHCHKNEKTGAAVCASAISPELIFKHIALAIGAQERAA